MVEWTEATELTRLKKGLSLKNEDPLYSILLKNNLRTLSLSLRTCACIARRVNMISYSARIFKILLTRRGFAKDQRLGFLCLKGKHLAYSCESKERCNKRGCKNPQHRTLLHDQERYKPVEVFQEEASTSKPTNVYARL